MLHGEHRQLEADHASDLARPQAAAIDHMLGRDRALLGDHIPAAIASRLELDDRLLRKISAPLRRADLA